MVPRHVTSLAAIFVCVILLGQAQSSPNAALLKLLAAKHSRDHPQAAGLSPSSSSPFSSSTYLNDFGPSFPSDLSTDGVGNEPWLETSAGSNPLFMRAGSSLTSSAGSPASEEEAEVGKSGRLVMAASKRFHPSAFFGSRGKRDYPLDKRFFHNAFVGSRGKRFLQAGLLEGDRMRARDAREEEREEEEEEEEEEEDGKRMSKRFDPTGFTGSRGKRFLPGLEALFLSQMYKKLDAEKWKRQSLLGFHAARG